MKKAGDSLLITTRKIVQYELDNVGEIVGEFEVGISLPLMRLVTCYVHYHT